ncbi:hypothetical protein FEM08_28590 [Flavobacterium gilvum]|nr:hypothetical protein FEM08_28590 [Flavobacterium gilvum]
MKNQKAINFFKVLFSLKIDLNSILREYLCIFTLNLKFNTLK